MIIEVKPISETSIGVRNKVVRLDAEDKWIAVSEMTIKEIQAFQNYKINYIDNNSVKTLPTITYDL